MTWQIEAFVPAEATEDDLRARYDLDRELWEELWAEDPMPPFEQWRKEITDTPSWQRTARWVVWNDDRNEIVGASSISMQFTETNRNLAEIDVSVRGASRRQGLGAALLEPVVAEAETENRTMLGGGAPTDTAGTSFALALGGVEKIVERKSRALMSGIDRDLLESWVRRAEERATGYSLLQWDGPVPEEYLDKFVALTMVMNTAPRDNLEMDDWIETPERYREREERQARQGFERWTLVCRHDETDELVGFTEFMFSDDYDPKAAWQEATAVNPVHRDKGIGRWLKAVNALRLMDDRPDIDYIDTWNAYSNGPMLGINITMGFEIVKSYSEYQISTERLAEAVKARIAG